MSDLAESIAANDALLDRLTSDAATEDESQFIEYKRVGRLDRALETVVAFANTSGGYIFLGIEDSKKAQGRDRILGIQENPEAVDELDRLIRTRITPTLSPPTTKSPVFTQMPCTLKDGSPGVVVMVHVEQSGAVHSLIDGGTYVRASKSNRQLSAHEITSLSLQRGMRSVVDEPVAVPIDLLDTHTWRQYAESRRITRPLPEALRHLRLAVKDEAGIFCPTRAAVLLFAEEPNGLLESKCTVRVFHYKGDTVEHSATTNLLRPPRTAGGPLIDQIRRSVELTVEALAQGVQVGPLGFEIVQKYPLRVLREALTNAIIHRDYRISADIHVRIFDTRIEIESPGLFISTVNAANIGVVGSRPRNRSLVDHLREFPNPPNLDAGEGVRMMVSVMDQAGLYLPVFLSPPDIPRDVVITVLLNEERPSAWRQVEAYATKYGSVGNVEVRKILRTDDRVRASKLLRGWVEAGILVPLNAESGKKDRRYRLPGSVADPAQFVLFPISKPRGNKKGKIGKLQ